MNKICENRCIQRTVNTSNTNSMQPSLTSTQDLHLQKPPLLREDGYIGHTPVHNKMQVDLHLRRTGRTNAQMLHYYYESFHCKTL